MKGKTILIAAVTIFTSCSAINFLADRQEREKKENEAAAAAVFQEKAKQLAEKRRTEWPAKRDSILLSIKESLAKKDYGKALTESAPYRDYKDPDIDELRKAATAGAAELAAIAQRAADADKAAKLKAELAERKKRGVTIGMSKEEVLLSSWGKPQSVNKTTTSNGTREQWVYRSGSYLYFEAGELVAIQN